MIYFIADTHFYHKNVIAYCNRPFKTIEEMNEVMINNWNRIVKNDDIVYHLGDFSLNNNNIIDFVKKLNGKIYLVRGNHDKKTNSYYNRAGFEVIPTQTKLDEHKIILSHRPLMDEQIPDGYVNIHGHMHNSDLDEKIYSKNKHKCVSVELIDYTPIELNKLI